MTIKGFSTRTVEWARRNWFVTIWATIIVFMLGIDLVLDTRIGVGMLVFTVQGALIVGFFWLLYLGAKRGIDAIRSKRT